jgi:heme-degrading monooxygenase HmoA
MSGPKKMTRYPLAPESSSWDGPVVVRGWLRVRSPWRHPIEAATLIRKWRRVRKALDTAPGFRFFEYWQRLEQLLFGMHVGWSNQADLGAFDDHETHRDIATWAIRSTLVVAMKLETFGVTDDGRVIRLGGFHMAAKGDDLPEDELVRVRASHSIGTVSLNTDTN